MWNYSFIFPTLMVLIVIGGYYLNMPRLPTRQNRTFFWLLLIEAGVILLDLFSSYADEHHMQVSLTVLYVLNMAFFVLFMLRFFLFYRFSIDILRLKAKEHPVSAYSAMIILVLCELVTLSSVFTGAVFYIDELGYHRGPVYSILYICFFYYNLLSLALLIKFRRNTTPFLFKSSVLFNLVLLIGMLIRIFVPRYLVMDTFCLVAILIIFLSFENPVMYLSVRGLAFNMRSFRDMLFELLRIRSYRVLGFCLQNYTDERSIYGGAQMDQGIILICQYLVKEFPEQSAFNLGGGRFALAGTQQMDWDAIQEKLTGRFQAPWSANETDLFLNVGFVRVSSASRLSEVEDIVNNLVIAFDDAGARQRGESPLIDLDHATEFEHMLDVKRALEHAVENNEVEVFLQPLVDCRTHRMVAAEALARIRDDQGNLIAPSQFIPLAEKNGQINKLGAQVFEKTCAFLREHNQDGLGLRWINVNLSPIQCMKKDLSAQFTEILQRYDISPESIHLEITEESMVDFNVLSIQLDALRKHGFQIALDDYGSGYSNLTRVKRYSFVNIKLDMEIVWSYFKERDNLLPAMIQTFKQMNYSITAEGIETEEMARELARIGCDYLQGYYFSKPLPIDRFLERYEKREQ